MKQAYCTGCRSWGDARNRVCVCGRERPAFNAGLASQKWATALNTKAARAAREG